MNIAFAALAALAAVADPVPQASIMSILPKQPGAASLSVEARAAAHRMATAMGSREQFIAAVKDAIEDRATRLTAIASLCKSAGQALKSADCDRKKREVELAQSMVVSQQAELVERVQEISEASYATRLSVTEMDAVTAFALTPAGRSYFQQSPAASLEATLFFRVVIDEAWWRAMTTILSTKASSVRDQSK